MLSFHLYLFVCLASDPVVIPKDSAQGRRTQSTSEAVQNSVTTPSETDSLQLQRGDSNSEGNDYHERRRSRDVDELDQRRQQKVRRSSFTRRSSHNFDQDRRRSKDGSQSHGFQRSRSVERSMDVEHSPSPIPQSTSPLGKSPSTPDSAIVVATLDTPFAERPKRQSVLKNKSSSSTDLGPLVDKDKQFHTLPSMKRHKRAKDMEVCERVEV